MLWSSLNLKDALALLEIVSVLWILHHFERRPRWVLLALALLLLVALESLRRYVFVGRALIVPIGVLVADYTSTRSPALFGGAAITSSADPT